jgi:hypothetical protein
MMRTWIVIGMVVLFAQSEALTQVDAAQLGKGKMFGGRLTRKGNDFVYYPYQVQNRVFVQQPQPWPTTVEQVKVYRIQGDQRVLVPAGLKDPVFQNIGDQGLYATWNVQNDRVAEVYLYENQPAFVQGYQSAGADTQVQLHGGRIQVGDAGRFTYYPYQVQTQKFATTVQPFPAAVDEVKVYQMQGNQRVLVPGGLKAPVFQNVGPQGMYGTWRMNGGKVSEIYLYENQPAFQKGIQAGIQIDGGN